MPTDAAHPAPAQPQTDPSAVFDTQVLGSAEAGYGAHYAEDGRLLLPLTHTGGAFLVGRHTARRRAGRRPAAESDRVNEGQRRADRARDAREGWWRQVAVRRRPAMIVAAALVAMGGFGVALSMVGDTVSSTPGPGASGDTAPVFAPKSPTAPSFPPETTASASSPETGGDGAAVPSTATGPLPGTGEQRDDTRGEDDREDHGREDGERDDDERKDEDRDNDG